MDDLKKATKLIDNGEYDKAVVILDSIISKNKSITTKLMAMVVLLNILKLKEDYPHLAKVYEELAVYVPSYKILMGAGEANLFSGNYKKSISLYLKSVDLAKDDNQKVMAYVHAVLVFALLDDTESCKRYYKKAEDLDKSESKKLLSSIIKKILSNDTSIPVENRKRITKLLSST